MTKTTEATGKLIQQLKDRHELGESWRRIAESFCSPIVKAGTLCSWVKGGKLPREYLEPLGLATRRQVDPHTRRIKRKIAKMAKQTKEAVLR